MPEKTALTDALMKKRAEWYINYVKKESQECINRRIPYKIASCDAKSRSLVLHFTTEEWMQNPGNVIHGGMICTMFDITMGITSLSTSGYFTPTVNMSVSFLSPLPANDTFVVTARATRVGKSFVQLVAEGVSLKEQTLCATATGVFFCANQEKLVLEQEGFLAD